jgi:HPt (histidine-containing phosphotransfer) domain-containing protein
VKSETAITTERADGTGATGSAAPLTGDPSPRPEPSTAGATAASDGAAQESDEPPTLSEQQVDAILQAPGGRDPAEEPAGLGGVPPPLTTSSTGRLPVLDLEQVQSIRGLGKPAVFERLCDMLFVSAKDGFARLDAALAAGDLEEIGSAAHALKSPVSNLGGRRLADLLERCELAALEARDLAAVRRSALGLKAHYAALVTALESETRRNTGTG